MVPKTPGPHLRKWGIKDRQSRSYHLEIVTMRFCPGMRLVIGLLFTLPLLGAAAPAEVIWRGDFETGNLEQWKGAPKADGIKVVQDPVREGKHALRIDGTNAAKRGNLDRIEFQHQPLPPGTAEGTERYFGWSVFVPQKLTDDL